MSVDVTEIVVRLVVATVIGGLVGAERERRNHPAGLRTHMLVCLGSALLMLMSEDMAARYMGHTNADPGRIAAQVVSGIGFLGAGTILREGLTVRGLTTAASLWVVAALGLAVGGGYYISAFTATILALITLTVLSRLDVFLERGSTYRLEVTLEDRPGQLGAVSAELVRHGIQTRSIQVDQQDNLLNVDMIVFKHRRADMSDLIQPLLGIEGVRRVQFDEA